MDLVKDNTCGSKGKIDSCWDGLRLARTPTLTKELSDYQPKEKKRGKTQLLKHAMMN
jgi:hypothetical protein